MLTALKRITKSRDVQNNPSGLKTMSQNLQKKFSQGVQYNVKIIIKGDTCCGKTSLFQRLQGKPIGEYSSTESIQVANVQWNYKNAEDVVKVEVWDIVDKGKKRPVLPGLKFPEVTASLDAEFLDVYKGTDGVIIVFDITKPWTFSYVQRELPKISGDIPVLILGNCCDMGHHRAVPEDTVRHYVDSIQRPSGQAQVRYSESSMVNGFGLRYIYKFLALPFLQVQRKTLKHQLMRNAEEIQIALEEIDLFGMGPHADYRAFQDALNEKRRQNAEVVGISLRPGDPLPAQTPSVIFGLGHPINRYIPFEKIPSQEQRSNLRMTTKTNLAERNATSTKQQMKNIEEFVPDGGHLDDQFFHETPQVNEDLSKSPEQSESDCEEAINPLVADFQEDIEPDQYFVAPSSTSYFNIDGANQCEPAVQPPNPMSNNNAMLRITMNVE
uniref:Rab-like protein 1 n=1 Tax=Lygus hesperus TaxID=30085 RepID=A0A0A9XAK0_LYGHE